MPDRSDAEDLSAITLSCVPGMTRAFLEALTGRFGGFVEAARANLSDLIDAGLPKELAERAIECAGLRRAEHILETCGRLGVKCLLPHHPEWPSVVERVAPRPTMLYVRGSLPTQSVAIVGSRHADAYGLRFARALARDLAAAGVCVVSGAALGIDGAAHQGALSAGAIGGGTLAVLGTGIDVVYPPRHRALLALIAREGALLSEFPPGARPLKHHFPMRNRLIAALSSAVVVVRAARGSGSLITAEWAQRLEIPLLATPGPAGDALSAGTHDLLRSGAAICASAEDVLVFLRRPAAEHPAKTAKPRIPDLDSGSARLLSLLSSCPASLDALSLETGIDSRKTAALMTRLELMGLAERLGGTFVRAV